MAASQALRPLASPGRGASRPPPASSADGRRWAALAFIALAQLMVALDATVVNIALPSAQAALRFSDGDRQWVISAYTLAFGGLLLPGGRIADSARVGRSRALLIGLVDSATRADGLVHGYAAAAVLGTLLL